MNKLIDRYKSKLSTPHENPIEEAKKMVSWVQQFVGIRDVFGDRERRCSLLSVLATALFTVPFVYTGQFSQSMYLVSVFPDKVDTFKAVNCISSTCVPMSKYIFMWTSRSRLRTIIKMSHDGLQALPEESRALMLQTLHKARGVSWLVILNQAFIHIVYLLLPLSLTVFTNERYLPTTPGESYGISIYINSTIRGRENEDFRPSGYIPPPDSDTRPRPRPAKFYEIPFPSPSVTVPKKPYFRVYYKECKGNI